jgi:hypothetical protein
VSNHGLTASRAVKGVICGITPISAISVARASEPTVNPVKVPFGTRGSNFPCQARMQPHFQSLRDNKRGSRAHPAPSIATQNHLKIDTISGKLA